MLQSFFTFNSPYIQSMNSVIKIAIKDAPHFVINWTPCSLTLTFDFQGQILKMLYLRYGRADWHGTKGMDVTPTLWLSTLTSTMTLIFDFQVQILKKSYLRNGMADWHGMKGMWVDRMLDPCCDFQHSPLPWTWPWIFKVKFWKSCISGKGWLIDMERKGCESIEC